MNLRSALLSFVGTPDRAWYTLLAGMLLIARECSAPGRVIPGVLGGVAAIAAVNALTQYHVTAQGVALAVAGLLCAAWQFRGTLGFVPTAAGAVLFALAGRWLIAGPWRMSWAAAAAGGVVVAVLGVLLNAAGRARRQKMSGW